MMAMLRMARLVFDMIVVSSEVRKAEYYSMLRRTK